MKKIDILTHSGIFHADDIFATATVKLYFKNKDKKIKLNIKRSVKKEDIDKADIVYDVGMTYNPKKLRFDHHQNDEKLVRENGIPYAAFGLVFKHFGPELISLISKNKNKIFIKDCYEIVEKRLIQHVDGMDNGKLTYKQNFQGVDIATIDNYFQMCKSTIKSGSPRDIDKKFFELVKFAEVFLENIILYAIDAGKDKELATKAYKKAKDKMVIICDKFYNYNFNKFSEPLLVIYPDLRGNWSAKVVEKGDELYDARFYFPEVWRGLVDEELEKVTDIEGSMFCHKTGFLAVNKTKEGILEMIYRAFKILKIK